MSQTTASRPPSATNLRANLGAYALGLVVLFLADEILRNEFTVVTLSLAAAAMAMAAFDLRVLKVHRRESTGLGPVTGAFNWRRIGEKLLAFYATLAMIAAAYATLPWAYTFIMKTVIGPALGMVWSGLFGQEFSTGILTDPQTLYEMGKFAGFFYLVERVLPVICIAIIPYTMLTDQRMREPRDGAWEVAQLLLGRWAARNWTLIRTYALGWTIKAFFLPIMVSGLLSVADSLISATFSFYFLSIPNFYFFLFKVVLFVDLSVAVLGYVFTTRLLDSHIRSCNPLLWGWVVTLCCYYPFWMVIYSNVLKYADGETWVDWLGGTPWLLVPWAAAILVFKLSWMVANATFGLRFSNLTHRGILTGGLFALTKHPSYVSKNAAWWMINMPFLSLLSWQHAVMNCICLLGINVIYFLRARAEERHLSEDPVYVAYALAMNEQGIFRWITRALPALAYRPPAVSEPKAATAPKPA